MSKSTDSTQPDNGYYILVTGANSGVGLALACRLVEEFLQTRPQTETLVLLTTTRDKRKGDATVHILNEHLQKVCRKWEKTVPGISKVLQKRIIFQPEILDLCSLISVQRLCKKLRDTLPRLDVIICNAGIGGWRGLNWPQAVWTVLTGIKDATTYPLFKLASVGLTTKPQVPITDGEDNADDFRLGEVFCANFFGHYLLSHYLAPLLANHDDPTQMRGRMIWTTSLDAYAHAFQLNDIQGLKSDAPYETSKRLTDLMGLTYRLPSTAKQVDAFLGHPEPAQAPRIYLAHPGICGTSIVPLPLILEYCMFFAFYLARWLGSPWHPTTAWKGAVSMVWIALAQQSLLDTIEEREGIGKWGSATDWWGQERVDRTEVEWYGYGGKDGEPKRKGQSPYTKPATRQSRKNFEEMGKNCWVEVEKLRITWEKRLDDAGVGIKFD